MAKCRVCHRELHDAAAIAAGIGPVCAKRAAAARTRTDSAEAGYPAEKYARIMQGAQALAESISYYELRLQGAKIARHTADVARYTRRVEWARRWYATWSRMEREAYRRMTSRTAGQRTARRRTA